MKAGLPPIMALIGFCCLVQTAAADRASDPMTGRLRQALAAAELRQGAASPSLLPPLEQLAEARWRNGDFAETEALRRRELRIAIKAFGSGSVNAALVMTSLAKTDIDRRRYLDAEPLLITAVNILSAAGTPDRAALANALAALARVEVARGSPEAAEIWAEQAVAIGGKDPSQPTTEPSLALAAVRSAQERYADSETLIEEALARDRRRSGAGSISVARGLAQLGNLYLRQNRYGEALTVLEEAAAIDQQRLAAQHPFVADDFYALGLADDALKRPDEARKSLAFAVKLLEGGPEKDSLRLGYAERELSRVLRAAGKSEEADRTAADSKRILNKAEDEERERERQL